MKAAALAFGILFASSACAQDPALTKERLGLSADRIVTMGLGGWESYYNARVQPSGVTRGVSYAVFVDAIREQNDRLYRRLEPARRSTLERAADLMKRYSDEVGEAEWMLQGGNAFNPKGDTEALARAETQMIRLALGQAKSPVTPMDFSNLERSLAARQRDYEKKLNAAASRASVFNGAPSRPKSQVASELRRVPNRLRTLASQIRGTLGRETVGVRFEAFTAINTLTNFDSRS
jgi:hypothetical protein